MAKNFGSAESAKTFSQIAKKEQVKATVLALKNITDDMLEDDPENKEDISYTADIELSIQQIGFSDPLEVTDFGMSEGHYRIVSGHRRRAAGRKAGMTVFPCIVRHYDNRDDLDNYRLLSNLHRDSARDPLLLARRYALHKDYLEHIGFKGSKREEIAKRLGGISLATLDRYANMNKIIQPVWELIAAEKTMVTSIQMLASHTPEEQNEIYELMKAELEEKETLSGADMRRIVETYRHLGESFEDESESVENIEVPETRDSGLPLMGAWVNDEPTETKEREYDRADEFRHDFDPIAAEYDAMDRDKEVWQKQQTEKQVEEVNEKQKKIDELLKSLKKLDKQLEDGCPSCNKEDAEAIIDSYLNYSDTKALEHVQRLVDDLPKISAESLEQIGDDRLMLIQALLNEIDDEAKELTRNDIKAIDWTNYNRLSGRINHMGDKESGKYEAVQGLTNALPDADIKDQLAEACEDMGMSVSAALRCYCYRVARTGEIPFKLSSGDFEALQSVLLLTVNNAQKVPTIKMVGTF